MQVRYYAEDGSWFFSEQECRDYEEKCKVKDNKLTAFKVRANAYLRIEDIELIIHAPKRAGEDFSDLADYISEGFSDIVDLAYSQYNADKWIDNIEIEEILETDDEEN